MARRVLFRGQQMRNRMIAFRRPVFLHPLAAQACGFLRRQPGPFGAAGANRDPNGLSVHVFLNRERASLRHRHTHFETRMTGYARHRQRLHDKRAVSPMQVPDLRLRLPQPVKRAPGIFARFSRVTATGKCIRRRKNAKIVKATRSRVLSATTQTEIPFCSNHARHHPSWCGRCGGTEHRQPILPHKTYVTGAGGQADAVEVFQNLDRHLPAIVETVTERCGRQLRDPGSFLAASAAIVAISATVSRRKK